MSRVSLKFVLNFANTCLLKINKFLAGKSGHLVKLKTLLVYHHLKQLSATPLKSIGNLYNHNSMSNNQPAMKTKTNNTRKKKNKTEKKSTTTIKIKKKTIQVTRNTPF